MIHTVPLRAARDESAAHQLRIVGLCALLGFAAGCAIAMLLRWLA